MLSGLLHLKSFRPVVMSAFLLLLAFLLPAVSAASEQDQDPAFGQAGIVMNIPGYPLVFELNTGDSILIDRTFENTRIARTLILKGFRLFTENNKWFPDSLGGCNYYKAEVDIVISGKEYTLPLQPYQMPVSVDGLRIYVEAVKKMDEIPNLDPLKLRKDVRFSVCLENEPWGIPSELEFPVNGYRWRSGSYNNTWSSLVPFNLLYYHRGEDLGAIPGKLDVCAWADANIIKSPYPEGQTNSNAILIKTPSGIIFDYYHCDIENIDSAIVTDGFVKKGQHLAKTGMTWDGRKSQHRDPHLHTGIKFNGYQISPFPYFVEAYFRKYDDKVLAIAGGYRFVNAGDSIELDGSGSICRDGEKIKSYQWKLHDGKTVDLPVIKVKYEKPGFYSEELMVETANGDIDKDFLQVRVNDQASYKEVGRGWAYCYPVRNIKSGQQVLFWNRLRTKENADAFIDFGDGSEVQKVGDEIYHSYSESGNYTVEFSSTGVDNAPVVVKLEVVVD